ncbi:TetR/AcrR family transcriptional regulator [Streptomyces sp. PSKA30]|uniref:TetR/AcrR family transcriptional regulator n=1 Tax=Streptomyces sp. PSKA30 TaxID=2874597 RepID=UPI001CD19449|nr:TetR/AcrR family transcriptional regulator [Streptomyces sp. PSKA30]MBZ9645032.1 TetR/AcrR family transcriptional regulator [Streptomyces sp. PSKA30]
MPEGALLAEQIIDAAGQALRRFGARKATVMDAVHILGVSHSSICRHFPDRDALRDAVVERCLARLRASLTDEDRPLVSWLDALHAAHRTAAHTDPELHAAYAQLPADSTVMSTHLQALATVLTDRLRSRPLPPWAENHHHAAATALSAPAAFLDPHLNAAPSSSPDTFDAVRDLVTASLSS